MHSFNGMYWHNEFKHWHSIGIALAAVLLMVAINVQPVTTTTILPATNLFNTSRRNTYGEFCNSTVKCKGHSWLSCRPVASYTQRSDDSEKQPLTECQCWDKDSMVYEESIGICVSKAGEMCKFQVESPLDNAVTSLMTICVSGASCHPVDGICICDSRHYENTNGTCSVGQTIQEPCSPPSLQCSRYQGLFCNLASADGIGVCACNETVAEYLIHRENDELSQCVGLAESPCINGKCVANAFCSKSESVDMCECDSSSYMDDRKRCKLKKTFSEACNNDVECEILESMQLICHDGQCNCNHFVSQHGTSSKHKHDWNNDIFYYEGHYGYNGMEDELFTQCLGLVDKPCQNDLCVPHAYCQYTDAYPPGTCICQPGYFESRTGKCGSAHGDICGAKKSCIDGLICRQGKCSCRLEDQKFDLSTKTCQSRVDGPCNDDNFGVASCEENALCIKFTTPNNGNETEYGICKCKPGFIENLNGECENEFGQPCSMTGSNCDSAAGLVCIEETCQCSTFSKYDKDLRACLTLVGGRCQNASSISECVKNASCIRKSINVGNALYGNCQCNDGYSVTSSYTCQHSS